MRVFLDANILFSAAKSDGAVRRLIDLLRDAGHECWMDDYVMIEARRNLAAKFPQASTTLDDLLKGLHLGPAQALARDTRLAHWLPEKDRPVLMGAIRLRCDALVTGDKTHFGAAYGKVVGGVAIHSPKSLAQWLLDRH